MGRPTPDPPRPIGHGPFKCRYCGRYGQPGACYGCGAPNAPVAHQTTQAGVLTINEARRRLGLEPIELKVPTFDVVKR